MKSKILKPSTPAYKAIAHYFIQQIEAQVLLCGESLPSIQEVQKKFQVSRDTAIKALYELRQLGIIESVHGKGFYVATTKIERQHNILLVLDTMRSFKEVFYKSFTRAMGENVSVDLHFHYHNARFFERLIDESVGRFTHYAVMPFFEEDITRTLEKIPSNQLIIVDGDWPSLVGEYTAIVQPFHHQILTCLRTVRSSILQYRSIKMLIPGEFKYFTPEGILSGYSDFCIENHLTPVVYNSFSSEEVSLGDLYMVIADTDMISLIEEARKREWTVGKELGIITIDDTPIRKVLLNGIATISTDFEKMGVRLAEIIQQKKTGRFENDFYFEPRSTLLI